MFNADFTPLAAESSLAQEILADINRTLPTFPDTGKVTALELAELPFYRSAGAQRFRLLKVTIENHELPLLALYSPGALYPLNGTNSPIYEVNGQAPFELPNERNEAVRVACEYARFFFHFVTGEHGHFLIIEPNDLPQSTDEAPPQDGDRQPLEWIASANDEDREHVKALVCPLEPIDVIVEDEGTIAARTQRVELQATILFKDTLFKTNIVVHANGTVKLHNERILRTNRALKANGSYGEFLTDIERIPPVPWVKRWTRCKENSSTFNKITSWLTTKYGNSEMLVGEGLLVREAGLPFYGDRCKLYEILSADLLQRTYLLGDPNGNWHLPIDWNSDTIHEANAYWASLGTLKIDSKTSEQYLRFFCWGMAADNSRFLIVDRFHDISWEAWPSPEIIEHIHPLTRIKGSGDLPDWTRLTELDLDASCFHFSATVLFDDALFHALFSVCPEEEGVKTVMVDDHPIASDLPVEPDEAVALRDITLLVLEKKPDSSGEGQPGTETRRDDKPLALQPRDELPHYLDRPPPSDPIHEVDAEEFLDLLDTRGAQGVQGLTVKGRVSFRTWKNNKSPCIISHVHFEDVVDLSGLNLPGIEFNHCVFEKGLSGRGVHIRGNLILHVCDLHDPEQRGAVCLDLEGARIDGFLRLNNLHCIGMINAQSMRVDGDAFLNGLFVSHETLPDGLTVGKFLEKLVTEADPADCWAVTINRKLLKESRIGLGIAVRLCGARIGGRLSIGTMMEEWNPGLTSDSGHHRRSLICGAVDAGHVSVGGSLDLSGLTCLGWINFGHGMIEGDILGDYQLLEDTPPLRTIVTEGMHFNSVQSVHGGIQLSGAWIGDDLDLAHGRFGNSLFARDTDPIRECIPLHVGGQLLLSGAEIVNIELRAARILKGIVCILGKIGRLRLEPGRVRVTSFEEPARFRIQRPRTGPVLLRSARIDEDCRLCYVRAEQDTGRYKCYGAVYIENCEIGGDLAFSRSQLEDYLDSFLDLHHAQFPGKEIKEDTWILEPPQPERPSEAFSSGSSETLGSDARNPSQTETQIETVHSAVYRSLVSDIKGDLSIRNCRIRGNLEMGRMRVAGDIRLERLRIDGSIYAPHYPLDQEWEHYLGWADDLDLTQCHRFILTSSECRHHADLTGLRIKGGEGIMNGSYLQVDGRMLLYPDMTSRNPSEYAAQLSHLYLTCACIDHLIVSGECFPRTEDPEQNSTGHTRQPSRGELFRYLLFAYPAATENLMNWGDTSEASSLGHDERMRLYRAALSLQLIVLLAFAGSMLGALSRPSVGWIFPIFLELLALGTFQRIALSLHASITTAQKRPARTDRKTGNLFQRLWHSATGFLERSIGDFHAFADSHIRQPDDSDGQSRNPAPRTDRRRFASLRASDWFAGTVLVLVLLGGTWKITGSAMFSGAFALLLGAVLMERFSALRYLTKKGLPCCMEGSEPAEADERAVLAFRGFHQIWQALIRGENTTKQQTRKSGENGKPKIDFGRARFAHLEIREPFPVPVDMEAIQVGQWKLLEKKEGEDGDDTLRKNGDSGQERGGSSQDDAVPYLKLLKNTKEFDRGTYLDMERYLRNGGHHQAADRVHRAMRRREQWLAERPLKIATMLLHSTIGYGTRRGRVLLFMFAWFLFSAFWFAIEYPNMIQITPELRAELNNDEAVPAMALPCNKDSIRTRDILDCIQPSDGHPWYKKAGIGVAMALRYHVPLVDLDFAPYLEPSRPWAWVYAMLVVAVHWILWPLLIASLIPVLIPRRE